MHPLDTQLRSFGFWTLLTGWAVGTLVDQYFDWSSFTTRSKSFRKDTWPLFALGVGAVGAFGVYSAVQTRRSVQSIYDTAAAVSAGVPVPRP